MNNSRITIGCSLVIIVCFLFSTSTETRPPCIDNNNITPDNETGEGTDDTVLDTFLETLQTYTGLGNSKVFDVKCDSVSRNCVVDSNGTAIWDARMTFYEKYMMDKIDSEDQSLLKNSLDGCLCYSSDVDDFRNCMQNVRKRMTDDLDQTLMSEFVKLVEANECALYAENCIQVD